MSLWSRPHLWVKRGKVFEAKDAGSTFPKRTVPVVLGLLSPQGFCGLVERLVEPISLLNFSQKPQKNLPVEERKLIGYRDLASAQETFLSLFLHGDLVTKKERTSDEGKHRDPDYFQFRDE